MASQLRSPDRAHPTDLAGQFGSTGQERAVVGPLDHGSRVVQHPMLSTSAAFSHPSSPSASVPSANPFALALRPGTTLASGVASPSRPSTAGTTPRLLPAGTISRSTIQSKPMDRAWLARRSVRLDPRRHPSISGSAAVSHLLQVAGPWTERSTLQRVLPPRGAQLVTPADDHVGRPLPVLRSRPLKARSMAAERLVTARRRARTLDLLAALSTGLDLADGHYEGHAQRTAYLALRLAGSHGASSDERSTLLYGALLKDAGESAEAAFRSLDTIRRDPLRSRVTQTQPVLARRAARGLEVARQLGMPESVGIAIHTLRERWDGRGGPEGLAHEAIPVVGRILAIAEGAEIGLRANGIKGAERVLRSRRGSWYDPSLVDLMLSMGKLGLWRELPADGTAPSLRILEPVHLVRMSDDRGLDVVAATFADLVDARTPRQGRHAARVGILAARTATRLGLPEEVVLDLRRAGLLHDIGKLGVPAGVFEKPTELNAVERDAVAAHPLISAAILERCDALAPLADLVRYHHERMDQPDRFPNLETPLRSIAARILALADRFTGMTAERPYRPALSTLQAIEILETTTQDKLGEQALRALKSVV